MKKKFFINSVFSAMPGFMSILLSFLSIPIYLKNAGAEEYGSYIFLHFLCFVSPVLNFGLGKISTIILAKNKKNDLIAISLLKKTIKNSILVLILLSSFYLINNIFFSISNSTIFLALSGIFITTIFITIEGIYQGKKLFSGLMLINFFFYGVSLSLPPILFIQFTQSHKIIFIISLLIKLSTILFAFHYLFKKKNLNFFSINTHFDKYLSSQKWFSISNVLNILYDFIDKYLIKIQIGSAALAIYSIPQQLTGKLSIFSKGVAAVLLPSIAQEKNNQLINKDFILSFKIFTFLIPILIFTIFNFYDIFFQLWLGKDFNNEIIKIAKIFSISTWISCLSHLIISHYEGSGFVKKNTKIELIFFPFFLFILYFSITNQNLQLIAIVILLKEILLFFFRSLNFIKKIKVVKYSYIVIFFSCYFLLHIINFSLVEFFKNG